MPGKLPQKSRGQKRNVSLKSTASSRIGSSSRTMTVIYLELEAQAEGTQEANLIDKGKSEGE